MLYVQRIGSDCVLNGLREVSQVGHEPVEVERRAFPQKPMLVVVEDVIGYVSVEAVRERLGELHISDAKLLLRVPAFEHRSFRCSVR